MQYFWQAYKCSAWMKTRSLKFSNNRPQVPEKKHENHFISFDFIHNELNVPMQCTQYATKVHDKTMQPMWSSCYGKNGNNTATKFLRRLHWNSMLPKDEINLSQTSILTLSKMPVLSTNSALTLIRGFLGPWPRVFSGKKSRFITGDVTVGT